MIEDLVNSKVLEKIHCLLLLRLIKHDETRDRNYLYRRHRSVPSMALAKEKHRQDVPRPPFSPRSTPSSN